ncbi:MAG: UDP-N-acetylenolpyruvoylglucosamine reductase [Chlamydiae bacterium]|nr:UDP-N-acetylenolpyruvoylglucosamine reductase [Chlamydiota bacterium]
MELEKNKSLSAYSTFGIGGPARYFIAVKTIDELKRAVLWAEQEGIPLMVIGRGSNSLFHDQGFDGLAIHNKLHFCEIEGSAVHVSSGYNFSLLGAQTAKRGLSGLEFASGIPGSVGGAIFMNAGASGGETADHLQIVTVMNHKGELYDLKRSDIEFAYRTSSFQMSGEIIVSARFLLEEDRSARGRQIEIVSYRTETQPYGDQSCGCVFRNPEKGSAGALIEQCGLKGMRIGGAEVSTLHGNFIVNREGATAEDVWRLGAEVRRLVHEKTGIILEWELRRLPYELSS